MKPNRTLEAVRPIPRAWAARTLLAASTALALASGGGAVPSFADEPVSGAAILHDAPGAAPAGERADDAAADGDAGRAAAARGDARDAEFFAENARQPGVVLLPGGVQARKLSDGTGPAAAGATMVVVNLSRRNLHDLASPARPGEGTAGVHDQRYQTQALPKPLYEAIQLMHVGDRWEVFAPAQGKGPRRAGHRATQPLPATVFTVELLSAH